MQTPRKQPRGQRAHPHPQLVSCVQAAGPQVRLARSQSAAAQLGWRPSDGPRLRPAAAPSVRSARQDGPFRRHGDQITEEI